MILLASVSLASLLAAPPAPADSTYSVSISTKRVRKHTYGKSVVSLVATVPAVDVLGERTALLSDFDTIILGSTNMRSEQDSFLAAEYTLTQEEMKARVEALLASDDLDIAWQDHDGVLAGNPAPSDGSADQDPRWYLLLGGNIFAIVPSDSKAAFIGEEATPAAKVFERDLSALLVAARKTNAPALKVVLRELRNAVKRANPAFELPNHIELAMEAHRTPELRVRYEFLDASAAKAFVAWWKGDFRTFIDGDLAAKIMLGGVIDEIRLRKRNRVVTTRVELTSAHADLLLAALSSTIEKEQARIGKRAKKRQAAAPP